jgi:hypothetical protein
VDEDFADLVVAYGGEVIIPETDGVEGFGLDGADEFVDGGGERGAGFGRADGNGDGDVGRVDALQREHGDAEAVAGGEAVIDEDEAAMGEIGWRSVAAVEGFAAAEFGGFARDDVVDDVFGDAVGGDEGIVEELHAAAGDGADGEFGIGRVADFADEEDVEGQIERAGDFGADGDTAARKREHEGVIVRVRGEMAGESLARFGAVAVAIDRRHGEASVTGAKVIRVMWIAMGENTNGRRGCGALRSRAGLGDEGGKSPIGRADFRPISSEADVRRLRR